MPRRLRKSDLPVRADPGTGKWERWTTLASLLTVLVLAVGLYITNSANRPDPGNPLHATLNLTGAHLSMPSAPPAEAHLAGIDLTRMYLSSAVLRRAELSGADLTGVNLMNGELQQADLRGSSLVAAKLGSADLTGADLTEALLAEADLNQAILNGADLPGQRAGALWHRSRLPEIGAGGGYPATPCAVSGQLRTRATPVPPRGATDS